VPITSTIKLQKPEFGQIVKKVPIVAKIVPIIRVANNPLAIPPKVTVKKLSMRFFILFLPMRVLYTIFAVLQKKVF
jgi:hypothetical protein